MTGTPTTQVEVVEAEPSPPLSEDHARLLVAAGLVYAGILILLVALLALHTGTQGPWAAFAGLGLVQVLAFGGLLTHRAYDARRRRA